MIEDPSSKRRKPTPALVHPSVLALMAEAKTDEKPIDVIRRKCRDMVAKAMSLGWSGPPFDPRLLASVFRIQVEETEDVFDGEGRIFPRRGRLVIQYRRGVTEERVRFTICHELAHTCFPDCYERTHHHEGAEADLAHKKFENLCDAGAAEFLFPLANFTGDMRRGQMNLANAISLSALYQASIEATVRRMLDLGVEATCAAALIGRIVPTDAGSLQVAYCVKGGAFSAFIPSGTKIPMGSVVRGAYKSGQSHLLPAKETWWIRGKPRTYYVEAHPLPPIPQNDRAPVAVAFLHSRRGS